jgi:hypothetical protein
MQLVQEDIHWYIVISFLFYVLSTLSRSQIANAVSEYVRKFNKIASDFMATWYVHSAKGEAI